MQEVSGLSGSRSLLPSSSCMPAQPTPIRLTVFKWVPWNLICFCFKDGTITDWGYGAELRGWDRNPVGLNSLLSLSSEPDRGVSEVTRFVGSGRESDNGKRGRYDLECYCLNIMRLFLHENSAFLYFPPFSTSGNIPSFCCAQSSIKCHSPAQLHRVITWNRLTRGWLKADLQKV